MSNSLYIAGTGPGSGKSVVVLGVMELLARHGRKIGFFRPVVEEGLARGRLTSLMTARYDIAAVPENLYGVTQGRARDLIGRNGTEELHGKILQKYRQLAHIAISSAETAQSFGIEPRVAMLSYSTGESGKGADVDKVREATRMAKQLRPDLKLEGPIQYDAAIDPDVARIKLPGSEVAGRATVFIFPDLNAGNNAYKAVQRAANAIAIGPVLQGLNKPVNDLSRGALVTDIVNTIAITAIQAQATGATS